MCNSACAVQPGKAMTVQTKWGLPLATRRAFVHQESSCVKIDMDMVDMVKDIIAPVVVGIILAALASLWLIFSKGGQLAWMKLGKAEGLRSVAVIAGIAFVLTLGLLVALVVKSYMPFEEVKREVFLGPTATAQKHIQDGNFEAVGVCPEDSVLINAYCQIGGDGDPRPAGGGNLQNLGATNAHEFHCIWNNTAPEFRASIKPVCARVVKK